MNVRVLVWVLVLTCMAIPTVTYGGNGPSNLRATGTGGDIDLTWDRPTEDASSVSGYRLQWDGRTSDLEVVRSDRTNMPSRRRHWAIRTRPAANERYRRFQVLARRGTVDSERSNVVVFDMETNREVSLPAAPEGVLATVSRRTVSLSWDDGMDATIVR